MLSPDEDFSQTGASSGINYAGSFKNYRDMLTENPENPTYKRIFSEFNTAVFGTPAPTPNDGLVVEDGDYDSELEEFRNALLADTTIDGTTDVGANETSSCPSPILPIQQDSHVAVSVTSHVSQTVAAASQVSNTVNSSVALLPGECEVMEVPSPIPKAARPLPKKKGGKPTKGATSKSNTTAGSTSNKPETGPANPPTRSLRKRN